MKELNGIFKLDEMIKGNHLKHYNIPYPDDHDYYVAERQKNDELQKKYEELVNRFKNLWEIPEQSMLGEKFPFAGYVTIEGDVLKCEPCEHENFIRNTVYNFYFAEYLKLPASFYDRKPQGMLQEEYFAMKYLGFAKISSFENAPTKRILFRYNTLTWKQAAVIYPT